MGDIWMLKGGACLVARARRRGRQRAACPERSRTQLQRRRSRCLMREKEGEETINSRQQVQQRCMTCLNDMQR